jgi:hypothetical protein
MRENSTWAAQNPPARRRAPMRVRAGSGGWAFLQRSEIGDSTVTSARELAFQFVNGVPQRFARALQCITSRGQRDGKCRISEVSWVINPGPILLRRYPGFEFVSRFCRNQPQWFPSARSAGRYRRFLGASND